MCHECETLTRPAARRAVTRDEDQPNETFGTTVPVLRDVTVAAKASSQVTTVKVRQVSSVASSRRPRRSMVLANVTMAVKASSKATTGKVRQIPSVASGRRPRDSMMTDDGWLTAGDASTCHADLSGG